MIPDQYKTLVYLRPLSLSNNERKKEREREILWWITKNITVFYSYYYDGRHHIYSNRSPYSTSEIT